MAHPNLFFSKEDVNRYICRLSTDSEAKSRYDNAVQGCKDCLSENVVTWEELNGKESLHANFGLLNNQANRWCLVLGTRYLVEKDTVCAEHLKKILLQSISYERWYAVSYCNRTPIPWHSDLCSTATTLAMSKAFDVIYDYLTPDERDTIAAGIFEKGVLPAFADWVLPETRIHALDSMGHNWWAVCIGEAAMALLALKDHLPADKTEKMFRLADEALAEYMTYSGNALFNKFGNFDDMGLFYESITYNNFGTGTLLRYLWASERYFGTNSTIRSAIPENLCDSLVQFSYPYTRDGSIQYLFLNFGDSSTDVTIDSVGKYAVRTGIASPSLKKIIEGYNIDLWEEIGGLNLDCEDSESVSLPKTFISSSGYALTRSSWSPDATLLAVKSGFCWNHSHNDSGSFVIFHNGKPFFIDEGTCSYDDKLYHAFYCQDHAHSLIKIGGTGRRDEELYRGTKFPGKLTDNYSGNDFFFIQADSTGPLAHLCSRMYRNFIWIDNRILVIFDDVYCHEDNSVQFTLHFDGTYSIEGNTVLFKNGDDCARLISHYPASNISVRYGHPDHEPDETKPFIEVCTNDNARTHLLINALELDWNSHSVKYELISGKNAYGIKITEGDTVRKIWFNVMADGHIMHDNSNNVIDGYDTDAYILMLKEDKAMESCEAFVVCGSYLRKDEKSLFTSFTKKTETVKIK